MSLSGSGKVTIPGNLVVLGGISGSSAESSSYALNADKIDNLDSTQLVLTSSFNSYTSSASSSLGSLSGSVATTTLNLSSSVSSSIGGLSGSIATTTSELSSSIGSLSSSVATTTSGLSSSVSSSIGSLSSSVATTTSGLAGRIGTIEGNYATTGSNTFIGSQVITGSLYITTDLIVQGSSSLQNITASAVSIGTNTVILNTDTPAVRFAGVSVQDSGSNAGVTGSIFWDGLCNRWVYSNPSGIGYSGGMLLSGPRTATLGSEAPLTCNYIAKSGGGDHLYDSCIIDDGTTTCIKNNLVITGTACFGSSVIATQSTNGEQSLSIINSNSGTSAAAVFNLQNDTNSSQIVYTSSTYDGVYGCGANAINIINRNSGPINFLTNGYSSAAIRMVITNCGIVGIGYISPVADDGNLVVAGAIGTGQGAANTVAQINIWETTSGNKSGLWFGSMTNANTGIIGSRTATGNIAFQTYCGGWAERMRIAYNGNVGIGTVTPGAKLEISSPRNSTLLRLTAVSGENWDFKNCNAVGSTDVLSIGAAGATANLNLKDDGNVGIGAASPIARLHTCTSYGANNIQAVFGNSNGSINSQVYDTVVIQQDDVTTLKLVERNVSTIDQVLTMTVGDNSSRISTTCANSLQFFVGGNPSSCGYNGLSGVAALTITCGGNVGIGTTGPNDKLTVWTPSTTGMQTALRLNNPFGFTNQNTGAKIVFSQDRSAAENLPMGEMGVGQEAGGTSAYGYMFFSTLNSTMGERMRITANGITCFSCTVCAPKFVSTGDVNVSSTVYAKYFRDSYIGGVYSTFARHDPPTSGAYQAFCSSQGAVLYITSMHNNGRSTTIINYSNGPTGGMAFTVINQTSAYGPANVTFSAGAGGWLCINYPYGGQTDFMAQVIGGGHVWGAGLSS
jgi:hypothetical protein